MSELPISGDPLHPQPASSTSAGRSPRNPLWLILGLSGLLFVLFAVVSVGVLIRGRSGESGTISHGSIWGPGAIGVIELKGVIMDSKRFRSDFQALEDNRQVRGILLRLDSPGGSVAPSQEIYQLIHESNKTVYASMGSIAASGAFYAAMGAKKIFANAGTITGSIGVIMEFANLEKLYAWAKVKRYVIKTGAYKDSGSEYREMRPDEHALLQGMINQVLEQFKDAVKESRVEEAKQMDAETIDRLADGRIFSGEQAKEYGFVDEVGTFDDAVEALAEQVGIKNKDGSVPLVYPDRPKRPWLEYLMDSQSDSEERSVIDRLVGQVGKSLSGAVGLPAAQPALPPGMYWLWQGSR